VTNLPRASELLARAFGRTQCEGGDFHVRGITCDSRMVRPGYVFIAVPGASADGAAFADQATAKGAKLIVTHRRIPDLPCPQYIVTDSRSAAAKLARAFYRLDDPAAKAVNLVGITGTNGKTTVGYAIQHICTCQGVACARLGTVDYDLVGETVTAGNTTPGPVELSGYIRRAMDHGAKVIAVEVSSHALDQARVAGLDFSSAVFTNLSGDHLDYHKTMQRYLQAKCLLFKGLGPHHHAVVNRDDAAADQVIACTKAAVLTYGIDHAGCDLHACVTSLSTAGSRFDLAFEGRSAAAWVPYIGKYNVYNAVAAVGAAVSLGLDFHKAVDAIKTLPAVPGRMERVGCSGGFDVFVDYAHTDDGLANVLQALRAIAKARVIVVFGCGGDRDRTKRPRMAAVSQRWSDMVVITSDNPRTEDQQAIIDEILSGFSHDAPAKIKTDPDRSAAIEWAIGDAQPGDIVLIAGKGHEPYQIIGTDRIPFDDRRQARDALRRRGCEDHSENTVLG